MSGFDLNTIKEHLAVLGLQTSFTKRNIKQAYHKLALTCHPDKSTAKSDTFVEVKRAYDILINAFENKDDDELINIESIDDSTTTFMQDFLSIMMKELGKFMKQQSVKKHNVKKQQKQHAHEGRIKVVLNVTLDDLYHGKLKKIKYSYLNDSQEYQSDDVYISLVSYQNEYIIPEKGDFIAEKEVRGDLQVTLAIEKHPLCSIDTIFNKYDLIAEFDLCLLEYYSREFLIFEHFGDIVDVPYQCGKKMHMVKGKGLPFYSSDQDLDSSTSDETNQDIKTSRGDLFVYFNTILPIHKKPLPTDLLSVLQSYFKHT
jgi:DnaJ-class molecular chaperone